MKEIKNVTLYQCDYCKAKRQRKWAMVHHEVYCHKNPVNQHPCITCQHLEVEVYTNEYAKIEGGDIVYEDGPELKRFRCTKLDKLLYSFQADRMGLPDKYPEDFEDAERMPEKGKCDSYQDKYPALSNFLEW